MSNNLDLTEVAGKAMIKLESVGNRTRKVRKHLQGSEIAVLTGISEHGHQEEQIHLSLLEAVSWVMFAFFLFFSWGILGSSMFF